MLREREISVASRLIDKSALVTASASNGFNAGDDDQRIGQCLLQLEIPIEVNRRVALHAA